MMLERRSRIRRLQFATALLGAFVFALWVHGSRSSTPVTTVYLVRHAEKAAGGRDPGLSPAGEARAQALAHVLSEADIDAIYVTEYKRTQATAAPLASAAKIAPTHYAARASRSVADRILAESAGKRVLVVGHSNTLDEIAEGLGANGLSDLTEHQYDRLFVVHRFGETAHLDRLRFGKQTP